MENASIKEPWLQSTKLILWPIIQMVATQFVFTVCTNIYWCNQLKKKHTNCRLLYKLFCTSPFVLNIFEVVIDTHIGLSVLFNGYIIVCCMDVLEFI